MNSTEKLKLKDAYLSTNYFVPGLQSQIVIRIGETNAALDELLRTHGSRT